MEKTKNRIGVWRVNANRVDDESVTNIDDEARGERILSTTLVGQTLFPLGADTQRQTRLILTNQSGDALRRPARVSSQNM